MIGPGAEELRVRRSTAGEVAAAALNLEQQARAAALQVVQEVMRRPDAIDLVNVGQWILDGRDPWAEIKAAEIVPASYAD